MTTKYWATFSLAVAGLSLLPSKADAWQTYVFDIDNSGDAVVVRQDEPEYPDGLRGSGHGGWVRMSVVVTEDGNAIDPIVVDSSGGEAFVASATEALAGWQYEAREQESSWNISNVTSEVRRNRNKATRRFQREANRFGELINEGELEKARTEINEMMQDGAWNLYESTILWVMLGRIDGALGNPAGKLEAYTRALAIGNKYVIPNHERVAMLATVFTLQYELKQFAAAARTHQYLQDLEGSEEALQQIAERAVHVEKQLSEGGDLVAQATIYSPCNCDAAEPLWRYIPARRTFSFANTGGNVKRFEARCEAGRLQDAVVDDKRWTLAPELGTCRVFVFGDDEATFDFVEHYQG